MTAFTQHKIPLWGDLSFTIDGNSKITCEDGSYDQPVPNAFSLPHIATCPDSTAACRSSCYVHGLQKHAPEVYRSYMDNERAVHSVLRSRPIEGAQLLAGYIAENCTRFRWHVSGDVFNREYAEWIVSVCEMAPGTKFWIYTRSLGEMRTLDDAHNLEVNISADSDNWALASAVAHKTGCRLCYMSQGEAPPPLPPGSVIFPDYPVRGRELDRPTEHPWWLYRTPYERRMVCPADFFGQSEQHRCGPCAKCLG